MPLVGGNHEGWELVSGPEREEEIGDKWRGREVRARGEAVERRWGAGGESGNGPLPTPAPGSLAEEAGPAGPEPRPRGDPRPSPRPEGRPESAPRWRGAVKSPPPAIGSGLGREIVAGYSRPPAPRHCPPSTAARSRPFTPLGGAWNQGRSE